MALSYRWGIEQRIEHEAGLRLTRTVFGGWLIKAALIFPMLCILQFCLDIAWLACTGAVVSNQTLNAAYG